MLPDPLHPAVVHFPIVLAVIAPLAAAGALWSIARGGSVRRAWGIATIVLAALTGSAWVALQTGEGQEEAVEQVVPERPLESHEEAAKLFLLSAAGVLVIAAAGLLRGPAGRVARGTAAAGTVALVALGWNVGRSGGELVYRHGAASVYASAQPAGARVKSKRDDHEENAMYAMKSETPSHDRTIDIRIPESMMAEHDEINAAITRATKTPGKVGEAARELSQALHPHFVREEMIALPLLGLLAPLSRGEFAPEMATVLSMTDSLREELPQMLGEHKAIRAATIRLGEVARAAGNTEVAELAERLKMHALAEEEMFYPAAVLVGDLVRSRLAARGTP